MTALMKPAGATRPCLHQGSAPLRGAASQCAMALNLRAGRSCNGPARTRSSGITSIPVSPSRTASSRASTAHCAMSCSTRSCSTAWLTPAGSWPSGATTTTMFAPTHRWEIERLHKRVGRSCRTIASRPARLCRRAYRNIQPQDSRYDRGTAGGQVTCLEFLKAGDTLVVWKLDRLGRSLTNLLAIITDLKNRGVAFRSLTEQMDTSTPHGELLFSLFGALAQYERALTRERVMAGLVAARRRGRRGGGPPSIDAETIEQITAALDAGASKASVCRSFKVPRSTLIGPLDRIGWTGPVKA